MASMISKFDFPAFILAGGYSKRFGKNKALHFLNGKPLIQYAIDTLTGIFNTTTVITKDVDEFTGLSVPVIKDKLESQSPLVGIFTGLSESFEQWNFFLACDMPYIDSKIITRIARLTENARKLEGFNAVVPITPPSGLQPLVACYHRNSLPALEEAIRHSLSVKNWISGLKTKSLHFTDDARFHNINRLTDLPPEI